MEILGYDELLVELVTGGGIVTPYSEWFEGSDGESWRNYSRIGTLSFAIFLLAQGNKDIDENAVQELMALFRSEDIPEKSLNNYVTDLKTGNAEGAFRGFLAAFSKDLQSSGRDKEQIFDNLSPTPSVFDGKVSETLRLTIDEASICYKNECYLATIALCGKIIETLLANAFQKETGKPPAEKMSFGDMRKALRGKGMPLDDSVDELLELIYTHRSIVVHHSTPGSHIRYISYPKSDEAVHLAGLTQVVVNSIYDYYNDQEDSSESGSDST